MQGLHLTADLHNCRCDAVWMTDAAKLGEWCRKAAQSLALQPTGQLFQSIPGVSDAAIGNISALLLLPGSHICVHCWPGEKAVLLDVFLGDNIGGHAAKGQELMQTMVNHFAPEWTEQRSLDRGDES